jgi:hypothetical protein
MQDLFKTPNKLPKEVQAILNRYSDLEIKRGLNYKDLIRMGNEMAVYGYEFDFYLDCVPYSLRKVKIIALEDLIK